MTKRIERTRQKRESQERERLPGGRDLPTVELRTQRRGLHPWVFRRMLGGPYRELEPGALVRAVGRDGRYVGTGFYNGNSEIALRLLTDNPNESIDEAWFEKKIGAALALRRDVLRLEDVTDAYRVAHSEGDGLSGLVVDRFANTLVVELFSAGMHRHLAWVRQALLAHFPDAQIVVRADKRSERHEGIALDGGPAPDAEKTLAIRESNVRFHVDLRHGHKTGFFLDQRENRARVAELARGPLGKRVFDGFCYTGGFGICAKKGGAAYVESVDLDEKAIDGAKRNAKLNGLERDESMQFVHGNVFDVLRAHRSARRSFSLMVLDPAKLAVSRAETEKAMSAYADMQRLGMQCLEPGGVLVACSCTGLVSEEQFLECLRAAASEARAELQIFHVGGAAADHPFVARVPEGRYLKAVFARVLPLP
ncbi:MAG: class I SAM-dependent rRNA methyltransferase [Planctomycetes bacterium]|nr:class I SAM-dependent rRNA methyltransferase [Planctomycetota bacterium]